MTLEDKDLWTFTASQVAVGSESESCKGQLRKTIIYSKDQNLLGQDTPVKCESIRFSNFAYDIIDDPLIKAWQVQPRGAIIDKIFPAPSE